MARILIVDDSKSVVAFISKVLEEAGYDVIPVTSGSQASALLDQLEVDLLITDIFMPDVDGFELLAKTRTMAVAPPVIAMSSNQGKADMLLVARRIGANACLDKPFNARQLLQAVATVLANGACSEPSNGGVQIERKGRSVG